MGEEIVFGVDLVAARNALVQTGLGSAIAANHTSNKQIWDVEARSRMTHDAESIRTLKQASDRWNQIRNDDIESIDAEILKLDGMDAMAGVQHSETPGMIIDRLSILSLKIDNMTVRATEIIDAGVIATCLERRDILAEQYEDLLNCLQYLEYALRSGRSYFRAYRALKSYNDPRFNR